MDDIETWLHQTHYARHNSKDGLVRGLPGRAYRDENVLQREVANWLSNTWVLAGVVHEIPGRGAMMPVPNLRIFLVHGNDGQIRAFHNICRHRGHELVSENQTQTRFITCPYHGWCYDHEGGLRSTSQFAGEGGHFAKGFNPESYSLRPVRCERWLDWIFVNLDGNAPPLSEHLGGLTKRLKDVDFRNLRHFHTLDHGDVQANWKLVMENSLEPYHTPYVHTKTGAGIPLRDHYTIVEKGLLGCGIYMPEAPPGSAPISNGTLTAESHFLSVPPLLIFVVYAGTTIIVHRNLPNLERPDRTHRTVYLYSLAEQPLTQAEIDEWMEIEYIIHVEEDGPVYENLQRGKHSPVTDDGGILSPVWEEPVRAFYETWHAAMTQTDDNR